MTAARHYLAALLACVTAFGVPQLHVASAATPVIDSETLARWEVAFAAAGAEVPVRFAALYVNNSGSPTCSDATAKASNSASSPWCTIGRAAWGSTTRSSPDTGEAAVAGDTVLVTGGTYSNALNCSGTVGVCKFDVLYGAANSGTAGNYLTFTCIGDCLIAAPDWNGPAIGANARNYIKWYANVALGYSWQINSYAPLDDNAASNQVDITADTGPAVCNGATGCWFEGIIFDGGNPGDPYPGLDDNYPAIRFEQAVNGVSRNNSFTGYTETANHGCGINNYHSSHTLIEHNVLTNSGCFLIVKDNPLQDGVSSLTIRYNRVSTVGFCFGWSITSEGTEPQSYVYRNICTGFNNTGGTGYGVYATGNSNSPFRVDIFNNTFIGGDDSSCVRARTSYGTVRFWNNICADVDYMIVADAGAETMPAESALDLEHDVFFNFRTQFYTGGDGNRNKASFDAAYNGQNDDTPLSIESDPLFADAVGGDYRLCTAAGAPDPDCSGASPALALGVDALDLDGDSNTTDNIPAGAHIGDGATIGMETGSATACCLRLRIRAGALPLDVIGAPPVVLGLPVALSTTEQRGSQ